MSHSDLFLSYRRQHKAFVRHLEAALRQHGREVWVDWDDIPPGSLDFTQDIERGIESSDAFVPVLTPDFFDSEHCMAELDHALRLGKRVVPVVAEALDGVAVTAGIAHINWVYFCPHAGEQNAFEVALPRLIAALDTDHAHVRQHTWLLMRAREWERHDRDAAYLLSGAELSAAQGWRAGATGKEPPPTPLHLDFLLGSQQAQVARLAAEQKLQQQARDRLRLAIGLLAAGIILILGGLAWFYAIATSTTNTLAEDNLRTSLEITAAGIDGDAFVALVMGATPRADGLTDDSRYWQIARFLQEVFDANSEIRAYTYTQDARSGNLYYVVDAGTYGSVGRGGYLEQIPLREWEVEQFTQGFRGTVIYPNRFTDALGTWVSGYAPITDSNGRVVGALALEMLMDRYLALPRQVGTTALVIVALLVVAGGAGAAVFLAYRQRQALNAQ